MGDLEGRFMRVVTYDFDHDALETKRRSFGCFVGCLGSRGCLDELQQGHIDR